MITNLSKLSRTVIAILALCSMCMITHAAFSQGLISYQGIITQSSVPLKGSHMITFRIYPRPIGSTPIYTDTQTISFESNGEFDAVIGQGIPMPIFPIPERSTDHYYLGLSIDGYAELTPRASLSDVSRPFFADTAGFARTATTAYVADTAAFARMADFSSVPRTTVNGISNAVRLVGNGSTSVYTSGDSISIYTAGIREIQNADGTRNIENAVGPVTLLGINAGSIWSGLLAPAAVATPNIADSAVTNRKLSPGSVTMDKISTVGTPAGRVLTANGLGQSTWQTVTAQSIQLPYSGMDSTNGSAFTLSNPGAGPALLASGGATVISSTTSSANGIAILGTT